MKQGTGWRYAVCGAAANKPTHNLRQELGIPENREHFSKNYFSLLQTSNGLSYLI